MEDLKKNTTEDALKALEDTMKLLGKDNSPKDGGVCVWVTPSGRQFCSAISQSDCALISGSSWVPGGHC